MHCIRKILKRPEAICLAAFLLLTGLASAHPFHTTTAEMEFNSITGRFEVALKIPASDFEHMVRWGMEIDKSKTASEHLSKSSSKNTSAEATRFAGRYIDAQFSITSAGVPCRFEWVGVEDDQQCKWIYFELVLPPEHASSGELTLTNKVLCDRNNDQFNTVVLLSKAGRVSLKTHERSAAISLPRLP